MLSHGLLGLPGLSLSRDRTARAGQAQGRTGLPLPRSAHTDPKWGPGDTGVHRHQFFREPHGHAKDYQAASPTARLPPYTCFPKLAGGHLSGRERILE